MELVYKDPSIPFLKLMQEANANPTTVSHIKVTRGEMNTLYNHSQARRWFRDHFNMMDVKIRAQEALVSQAERKVADWHNNPKRKSEDFTPLANSLRDLNKELRLLTESVPSKIVQGSITIMVSM